MNPDELYKTTRDPANRHLVPLTTTNMDDTLDLYNQLMGKQPNLRRDFIMKNKLTSIEDADVFDDEEDFDE